MIITRPCLVTVTRALQALVQLLAQTRDLIFLKNK